MTAASAIWPGLALLGVGIFVAILALWDQVVGEAQAQWARYAAWATDGLDRLHLNLGAADLALRHVALVAGGWILGTQLSGVSAGLALAFAGLIGPKIWMTRAIEQRRKALDAQLDTALQTIANNMLATQSLVDGFLAVATHLEPPVSQEAALVVNDVRVGARTEEALANLSERCQSLQVDAVVVALTIGLRTGGDLGKVLKTIAGVVRETLRCEGLMAAKTAEGRASAWVMGAMPVVFTLAMHWVSPQWLEPLFNDVVGQVILVAAAILTLLGMVLVLKISKIDP
ncbi:MAG: Flp pilus assembly protein TadB [Myxococcales bacterium]|nr:Flp pilus assembly protein TadB [Myxococcales bacterium]